MRMMSLVCLCLIASAPLQFIACTQAPPASPGPTAEQKPAPSSAPSVAGTWSWSIDAGGNAITQSVKLTQNGEKLTGTFTDGFDNTTHDIKDGKIHNGQISFTVVRPFMDAGELTLKFDGKVDGAAITGKVEFTIADQPNSADWNAKRSGA